ncbi:hypothetical protein DFQ10_10510 [Winogradskyella eximia]|uniref:Uncharacterized protein n=1 Tax=Winogradskyella eximia TaxID=262006 RepID=A0A3D9H1N4_9FLAO|nr:hypothetical protein [Winogradskyella eximia]RED43412.1 hypothetical protein DFQ10_10510 [Winogradskyella eximia]
MIEQNNTTKDLKFYSQKSIGLATFIGGPLAAGYLIKENYKALNENDKGKTALIISILATVAIFGTLFLIPEAIMDKVPNMVIPAVYTGIIYLIVNKIHGTILDTHEAHNNTFYSGWKAAGIGLISLIVLMAIIVASIFLVPDGAYDAYDAEMEQFTINEEESLVFYEHFSTEDDLTLLNEINDIAIPKWKENIAIINRTNDIEDLPLELIEQNKKLLKYSELRLEAFELLKKLITYDSENYNDELDRIHNEIDAVIESLY